MNSTCQKIFLVEDDFKLAQLIKEFLESRGGMRVEIEPNGTSACSRIPEENPDLVILDVMLPGTDGLTVCKNIRPRFSGPVIMLTALGEETDEIAGFDAGADDYLSKPVNPKLLLAHVSASLRRASKTDFENSETKSEIAFNRKIDLGKLVIDPLSRTASIMGDELMLTTSEFEILLFLAKNAGTVVDRETLYTQVLGIEWDGLDRSVDQRIRRLRKKLGDNAKKAKWIKSVRGTGYILAVLA